MEELNKDKVRGNYIMKAKFFQLLEEMNKADPRFTVYAKALLFYYMPNQGELFITHNWYIADLLGIHEKTLLKAKKELVNRGVICVDPAYSGKKNNRISGTYVTVNYDWKTTNDRILNNVIQNNVIQNDVIQNDVILNNGIQRGALIREKDLHRENDLPRENDLQGKDLTREKAEGAAAKPQPAPPPGTASKGSSFPETAQGQQNGNKYQIPLTVPEVMKQGQTDLFGVPERVPAAKPKKPKGKRKAAGEIEIPEVEEIKSYIAGYIQENYEKGVHSYIWTDWELTETAKDIQAAIPKYKWKDWKQGARNWIRNNRDGAFKPKMRDPARDTRNQPGRARGQQNQKMSESDVMAILTGGNTSQETFEAESVRTIQD